MAHRTPGTIRGNPARAFGHHLAAIPIAAFGLRNLAGAGVSYEIEETA